MCGDDRVHPRGEIEVGRGELTSHVVRRDAEPNAVDTQVAVGVVPDPAFTVRDVHDHGNTSVVPHGVCARDLVSYVCPPREPFQPLGDLLIRERNQPLRHVYPLSVSGARTSSRSRPIGASCRGRISLQSGQLPAHAHRPGLDRDGCRCPGNLHRLVRLPCHRCRSRVTGQIDPAVTSGRLRHRVKDLRPENTGWSK